MTANNSKSCHDYLNKLVDQYNNSSHGSICEKPIHDDYSGLPEEFKSNHKVPKFKIEDKVRITKY